MLGGEHPSVSARSNPVASDVDRVARLEHELAEAIEQQTATSQVLEVIGRSDFRLERVFETVVRHAVRLCRADCGYVYQLDGDVYRTAFIVGGSQKYREYMERHPVSQGPETLVGRVGLERRIVQIPDVLADPIYRWPTGRELGGYRTMLGAPMLVGDRVVGVLILWRLEVDPFGDRTIDLLTTFAAQAAIAIRNVQLFQDLTRSVDELRALGEISQAVSSSLDLDEVLTTIVTRAVQLSGTEGGSIFEFDQATRLFHVRTCFGTEPELVTALRATRIHLDETFVGRAAASGEPQSAPDLSMQARDPHIERLARAGWRSMLVVPLRWEQEIIGALVVRRRATGAFPARSAELLETLASQSAVAIHNARVFRQLEDKSHQLEVASRHKSEFLASMSHELRTPLNAVIGFSDVLLERMFGDLNERQDEYLRDIRDSGRHLLELINEILDLSKVEAGRMELDPAHVALSSVLEHGLAMVRERAERGGVSLELTTDPAVDTVWADELKLKQVVLNLLTNAVKFTEAGGSVVVTARRNGDVAEVTVRDTGIGIADEDRERIFEAFQRGDRGVRTSTEGTGLGLTLSKRIVELHGGRLWMESAVGEGSLFGFSLPLASAAAPAPLPPATAGAAAGDGRRTVVVIDDDPLDLDLVEAVLAPEGYTVVRAASGEEGVRLVRHEHPLVVLLDLRMPDMDGFEVAERLRADPETADVPIIVLTHMEMTRADRDRLAGRVNHLAQKGHLDRAALVGLVGHLGAAHTSEQEGGP
jgi:signal transduction histidine kinase/CheY-like chemotaxis protein